MTREHAKHYYADYFYFEKNGFLAMDINVVEHTDHLEVSFYGEIDILSIKGVKEQLSELAEKKMDVVVNFENLDYLDSSGIGILLSLHKTLSDNGNKLSLVHVPEKIESILRLSSLNTILN